MARALAALLVLVLFITGCSMTAERLPEQVEEALGKAESYYAELEATVYSTEGEQYYRIKQWMEAPANWRVEVTSTTGTQVFICDGTQIYVYQPGIEDHYRLDADLAVEVSPPFFLAGYLNRLLEAEEYSFEGQQEKDGQKYYVASFKGGRDDELVRLWLDRRSRFPVIVETFINDQLLSRVKCTTLQLKDKISPDLFQFSAQDQWELESHCLVEPMSLDEAQDSWPYPVYTPGYVPEGSFLFLISQSEEKQIPQLLFIYKGDYHFTVVQSPSTEKQPHLSEATQEVVINGITGYYHPNTSDELATLWWSNETISFVLSGSLPQEEMLQVAESMQTD
ncbi:DUF4367 domain-containing protein [Dethiobacter alkaliphilus]|uniref:DUF4367 domain-containing protein n=1 Tax=Dethiobacter alkaliphilus TaxID=427926 RepID=UPI0022276C29|nr:DUF4367 domain-containing protein [Dethiobacter alkaliphilus]MCW3490570.1 DUF4367 domain-containing protein [Dethiobacter alkaliphilus]